MNEQDSPLQFIDRIVRTLFTRSTITFEIIAPLEVLFPVVALSETELVLSLVLIEESNVATKTELEFIGWR